MKYIYFSLKFLLTILIIINVYLLVSDKSYIYKAIQVGYLKGNKTATIEDLNFFETNLVASGEKDVWPISKKYNFTILDDEFRTRLEKNKSIAFIVIKEDSLLYEEYWGIGSRTSRTNSFSMAKSIISILIGIAIDEGYIKNVDQKMIEFLPEYNRKGEHFNNDVTIKHLLTMSSGIDWNEDYFNPFGITAEAYFTSDLNKLIFGVNFVEEPGEKWKYKSGNTQILSMILERVTKKNLSKYTSEKLWKPMGASDDAEWMIDQRGGVEKAYCCMNSNALDFARFGQLFLKKGNWKGVQLVDSTYVENSLQPDLESFYGYSWWLYNSKYKYPVFCMRGVNGQYVFSIPELDLVAVRLGHKKDTYNTKNISDIEFYIKEIIKQFDK